MEPTSTPTLAAFAGTFRRECFELVEYSVTRDPRLLGTMVAGFAPEFVERSITFGRPWPGSAGWETILRRLLADTSPAGAYFKVDWADQAPRSATLYGRYLEPLPIDRLSGKLDLPPPSDGSPSAADVAGILGVAGPSIVGVRIRDDAEVAVTHYLDVRAMSPETLCPRIDLVARALDLPQAGYRAMQRTIDALGPAGRPELVGVCPVRRQLKIDFAEVPVQAFFAAVGKEDHMQFRREELRALARQLRQPALNYLGVSCGSDGAFEWKAYFAVSGRHTGLDAVGASRAG